MPMPKRQDPMCLAIDARFKYTEQHINHIQFGFIDFFLALVAHTKQ